MTHLLLWICKGWYMSLSDTLIRKTIPKNTPIRLSDERGLFLLISPKGTKSWRWKYRFNGNDRLMTLGKYPVLTLQAAREKHLEAQRKLLAGIDPAHERKNIKLEALIQSRYLFKNVALLWHEHWRQNKSPRHAEYVYTRLMADVFPMLGERG